MKNIKTTIYLIGVGLAFGIGLITYANSNFASKEKVKTMHQDIRIIQSDVKLLLIKGR